ncbi:MAG: electron transfer flavoprotein subunit alpha/FixB family protein [Mogibacterium sp.]|nr:electron transfer flavoprotein subunit alpha/FixB family protein [Mogibacterium sp.]
MAYNSKEIAAFRNVWVFCEQRQGVMMPTAYELLSEGRRIADELGAELCGLLLGDDVDGIAAELGGYGAEKVYVYNSPLLKEYTTDGYTKVVEQAVRELKPEILLFGASSIGRDLAPRCAARLQTGLCADCTHLAADLAEYIEYLRTGSSLDVDSLTFDDEAYDIKSSLKMTKPAFGGNLMATILCPAFRPVMATVRPGVLKKMPFDEIGAKAVKLIHPAFELDEADIRTEVLEVVKEAKAAVDLTGAECIVAVGRGIAKDAKRGIALAEELAELLGGVVGASRAVVDAGWLGEEHMIGQTGKTVRPKLYIALGISGAIQHKSGMQESEYIIAVNKDEKAQIFEGADWGIAGDLFEVVPLMIDSFKKVKAV